MKLLRTVQQTSRHILRNPNALKDTDYIFQDQPDYRSNTVKILDDPQNDRKLILVGTLNCSDFLAKRTQKLLNEYKPDSVLVQTTSDWYDKLNCKSNNILTNKDIMYLSRHKLFEHLWAPKNFRGKIFLARFYSWALMIRAIINVHFDEVTPLLPSLEVYNAIKYARENNKDIFYADKFLGLTTINAMKIEKRLSFLEPFLRKNFLNNRVTHWSTQYEDTMNMISLLGMENYSESIDYEKINFMNSYLERIIPHQKRIFVDKTDIRLFKQIYTKLPGKKLFALVNYWNMPGVENHWRHSTQTELKEEFIHPLGDMDINSLKEADLIGDYLRRRAAKNSKTEPGLTCNYISQYHKMTTEPERERHAFFDSYKDPELEHSLYNGENENVKDMPYKIEHHQFNLIL